MEGRSCKSVPDDPDTEPLHGHEPTRRAYIYGEAEETTVFK
jgi:hypothetical protein